MNEFTGYQKAVMTFYSMNGEYLGDIDKTGVFATSAYVGTKSIDGFNGFDPTAEEAPFVELYLEKIIDFKPTTTQKFPTSTFGGELMLLKNLLKNILWMIKIIYF